MKKRIVLRVLCVGLLLVGGAQLGCIYITPSETMVVESTKDYAAAGCKPREAWEDCLARLHWGHEEHIAGTGR